VSAGGEVEGGGAGGTEVDRHRLGVVGVDVHAGRGDHCVKSDRAAQGVVQGATTEHAIGVQLEGSAGLLTLEHVLDQAVGERKLFVGHVSSCGATAVAKTGDVVTEGDVLTRGLTDGCYVDLGPADLEAPVADLTDDGKVGVGNLELVGGSSSASVSDGDGRTTGGGRNLQHAGCWCVGNHVISGTCRDAGGEGASAGAAGLAVDHAELDGIAYLEVQVGGDSDLVTAGVHVGYTERSGGSSGLVVEGAGRAGQYGSCHWLTKMDGWAGTARLTTG